jgi:transposase-like protein
MGRTGFPEAIRAADPQTKVQRCVAHWVRAALKYVSDKDSREGIKGLKTISQAATASEAEQAWERFTGKWDGKYPTSGKQGRLRGADIMARFEFPPEVRRAIDTTNAIESVNSAIRGFTRNRKQDPSADSAVKRIDLATSEASRRWTMPIVGWKQALNHFAILFEGRLSLNLNK